MDKKEPKIHIADTQYEANGKQVTVFAVFVDDQMVLSTAIRVLAEYCAEMLQCTLDQGPIDWFEVNVRRLRKAFDEAKVLEPDEAQRAKEL